MNDCDICKIEFTASKPNPAVVDAPIRGMGGMWGYLCEAHKSHALPGGTVLASLEILDGAQA